MLFTNPDTSITYVDVVSESPLLRFCHERRTGNVTRKSATVCHCFAEAVPGGPCQPALLVPSSGTLRRETSDRIHAIPRQSDPCCRLAGRFVGFARACAGLARGLRDLATVLRNVGGDTQYRILQQERVQGESHSGNGCESLRLESERGHHLHCPRRRPTVDHRRTVASVWVKADRPGVQLAARIVLPSLPTARTGRPVATIIVGDSYNAAGRWQQLQLSDIPRLLARQSLLRMQLGPQVDEHEAYIDAVLRTSTLGRA